MHAQKYPNKKGYKSEGKCTKPFPYIFTVSWKDEGMDVALYINTVRPLNKKIFRSYVEKTSQEFISYRCFIYVKGLSGNDH